VKAVCSTIRSKHICAVSIIAAVLLVLGLINVEVATAQTAPTVVRSFPGALPALPTQFIKKSTLVTITFVAPWSGQQERAAGLFANPCFMPGLPGFPAGGQITFQRNGDPADTIQFPAVALLRLRADGMLRKSGGGIDLLGVPYEGSGTSQQPFPALFYVPVPPSSVKFGDAGAIDVGKTFVLAPKLIPAAGNPDPIPLNALHTGHIEIAAPTGPVGAPPTGWHQFFAVETAQVGTFNRTAAIVLTFGGAPAAPGPSAPLPQPVMNSHDRDLASSIYALGVQLALARAFETSPADSASRGARWSNLSNARERVTLINQLGVALDTHPSTRSCECSPEVPELISGCPPPYLTCRLVTALHWPASRYGRD